MSNTCTDLYFDALSDTLVPYRKGSQRVAPKKSNTPNTSISSRKARRAKRRELGISTDGMYGRYTGATVPFCPYPRGTNMFTC